MSLLNLKTSIGERTAVLEKALKSLAEIDSCSKKAENTSRLIRTLTTEEDNLRELAQAVQNQLEEVDKEWSRLQNELGDMERKTKNILSIEGLSLEEKEKHSKNLASSFQESKRARDRQASTIDSLRTGIARLNEVYDRATERLLSLQTQFRSNLNLIVQQAKYAN